MNNRLLTITVLSTLALGACSEDSPNTNTTPGNPVAPIGNPFQIVPPDDQPQPQPQPQPTPTPTPTPTPPVAVPPLITPPVSQPVTPPVVGSPQQPAAPSSTVSAAQLINGSSLSGAQSYWQCEVAGNTDPDDFIQITYLSDQSGQISSGTDVAAVSWDVSGSTIFLTATGSAASIEFSNVNFTSSAQYAATLSITGSGSAPVICDRVSESTTPVTGGNPQPVDVENLLVNAPSASSLSDFWNCELQSGEDIQLFFLVDGTGGLISSDFPEGILMTWNASGQAISIVLSDGNQVVLSAPQFDGFDYFIVNSVAANGVENGSMECELFSL